MKLRMWLIAVALVTAALVLAACGGSDDTSGGETGSETSGTESTAETESGGYTQETIDIGLKQTGGTAGEADSSLEPLKVGITYQLGGVPAFPEMEAAANATVDFINTELGGADGHPVELISCNIQAEEDGQKCGAELRQAEVPIGMQTLAVIGNTSLYQTVDCAFPILVGSPSTGPDTTSECVYTLGGGGSAVIYGMAADSGELAEGGKVALVSVGNQGGRFTMEEIAEPALDALDVEHSTTVYYPDAATTPEIVSAVQASGAADSKVIFFDPSTPQQCSSLFQAMSQLGLTGTPVVATGICNAPSFVDEDAGGAPEGWRIWGFGPSTRVLSDPEVAAFNNIMETAGETEFINAGFSSLSSRDLLAITSMANNLGAEKWTAKGFEDEILAYKGPAFLISGPQHCGKSVDPAQVGICAETAGGGAYENGEWVTIGPVTWPGP